MDQQVTKLAEETLARHKALAEELSDPNIYSDQRRYAEVAKEHARMRRGAEWSQELLDSIEEAREARELIPTAESAEEREFFVEEAETAEAAAGGDVPPGDASIVVQGQRPAIRPTRRQLQLHDRPGPVPDEGMLGPPRAVEPAGDPSLLIDPIPGDGCGAHDAAARPDDDARNLVARSSLRLDVRGHAPQDRTRDDRPRGSAVPLSALHRHGSRPIRSAFTPPIIARLAHRENTLLPLSRNVTTPVFSNTGKVFVPRRGIFMAPGPPWSG